MNGNGSLNVISGNEIKRSTKKTNKCQNMRSKHRQSDIVWNWSGIECSDGQTGPSNAAKLFKTTLQLDKTG